MNVETDERRQTCSPNEDAFHDISASREPDIRLKLTNLLLAAIHSPIPENELLRRAVPEIEEELPREVDLVSVNTECGQSEETVCELLDERLNTFHPVFLCGYMPGLASGQSGCGCLQELARPRSSWSPPVLLTLFNENFSRYPPERVLSAARRTLSTCDRFLFTVRLCPNAASQDDMPRESGVVAENERVMQALAECGLDAAAIHIRKRVNPVETPWGYIHRTDYRLEVKEFQRLEVDGERWPLYPHESWLIHGRYRASGYQLERYLWRHGFHIEQLHIRDCDNRAAFLVRKQSLPEGP